MRLRSSDLFDYAAFMAGVEAGSIDDAIVRLRSDLDSGRLVLENVVAVRCGSSGEIVGSMRLVPIRSHRAILTSWRGDEGARTGTALRMLLEEAVEVATDLGFEEIGTRVATGQLTLSYRTALQQAGFRSEGERVEYRTPVEELPTSGEVTLEWRTMAEVGADLVLQMLVRAGSGSPDALDLRKGKQAIDELLGSRYGELDPRSAQVGYLDGHAATVLLVRVDGESGWSTFPFMGVEPAFRGKGLGAETQRHGFVTIRQLGGREYHDGTSASNEAMVRLFERHGCIEVGRMETWSWKRFEGEPPDGQPAR